MELAERTTHIADAALAEARARRRDLVLPLAIIGVLMMLLTIKLRRLEREPPDTRRS